MQARQVAIHRIVEAARQGTREAVMRHHSLGRATTHEDGQGLYLCFPDQSIRHFPAADFPAPQRKHSPHFLRWAVFMKELFKLLDCGEWENVTLHFGPHDRGEWFVVRIAPHALRMEHWRAANALAERVAALEHPPCFYSAKEEIAV